MPLTIDGAFVQNGGQAGRSAKAVVVRDQEVWRNQGAVPDVEKERVKRPHA
jgi:hypothetical protein